MKFTCMIFTEGGSDRKFLNTLIPLLEEHHAKRWNFNYDNASGSSPKTILSKCKNLPHISTYDLIICFIDLDKLKMDYPKDWRKEKGELEKTYSNFIIFWQIDNLEEEFKKVLGPTCKKYGKHKLNKFAKKNITKFKNSSFWKKLLKIIKTKENKIDNSNYLEKANQPLIQG